jgi:KDO2-lipid IV(A) lauroyltransferase
MEPLAAVLLRALAGLLGRLPVPVAYALADAAAPAVAVLARRHDRRAAAHGRGATRNQRIAYREAWTPDLSRRLQRGQARHLTRLVVDFARLPRLDAAAIRRCVDLRDFERLRKLAGEGRGVLCVSGHIGAWELPHQVSSRLGLPATVVARPARNAGVERVLRHLRTGAGQRVLDKRGALWKLTRALRRGDTVGLLADEDTAERGVFAPFLGTPAATSPVPAFLQRVTGAPIAVLTCPRVGTGRFRFRIWRVIRPVPGGDTEAEIQRVTEAINAALSEAILAYPEQWLWGSRRFATRPAGEVPGADGLPPAAPGSDASAALG